MTTFVKLNRGELSNDLLECHPNAFLLLSLIALRARRTPNLIKGLDICECQLGDYKACGLTEQKYRTAKKLLESLGLVTFHSTNKGTVAKINNSSIYDINVCEVNGPITGEQRTPNERVTTNKNVKKEKNEKKKDTPPKKTKKPVEEIQYPEWLNVKLFDEFIQDRRDRKHTVTPRAIKGLITALHKACEDRFYLQDLIIEKSITNSWKSFFPLKPDEIIPNPAAEEAHYMTNQEAFDRIEWETLSELSGKSIEEIQRTHKRNLGLA